MKENPNFVGAGGIKDKSPDPRGDARDSGKVETSLGEEMSPKLTREEIDRITTIIADSQVSAAYRQRFLKALNQFEPVNGSSLHEESVD